MKTNPQKTNNCIFDLKYKKKILLKDKIQSILNEGIENITLICYSKEIMTNFCQELAYYILQEFETLEIYPIYIDLSLFIKKDSQEK